jgi:hypothetical protein
MGGAGMLVSLCFFVRGTVTESQQTLFRETGVLQETFALQEMDKNSTRA